MSNSNRMSDYVKDEVGFLKKLLSATTSTLIENLLGELPVQKDQDYTYDRQNPSRGWQEDKLHWVPVGAERGNAGRIKLAGSAENPIGERLVNAMEGIIELERQRELLRDKTACAPVSPREAVLRYFGLPSLDLLPQWPQQLKGVKATKYGREIAKKIRVKLLRDKNSRQYTVLIEDEGIGQAPSRLHVTLLSLGSSDKGDKPYLIGVFGQGGSSAYAASEMSWMISRRAPELVQEEADHGCGWTVIRHIFPRGRRDDYYAYLAAKPDGSVPCFSAKAADVLNIGHGTRIAHVDYDFGKSEPARTLYASLNHLLFNPVLPYELTTGPDRRPDPMYGNAYRLSKLPADDKPLDKKFDPQAVTIRS